MIEGAPKLRKVKRAQHGSKLEKQGPASARGQANDSRMEDLERIIPDKHQRDSLMRLLSQLGSDEVAITVLKGHLVIEEKITAAIEKFVFHPEHLEDTRLTFAQKLAIARSMSLDENKNSMWDLIAKLNRLRNALSHSLDGEQRRSSMDAFRAAYIKERDGKLEDWEKPDEGLLLAAVPMCLGFLDAFEQEVERFKEHVARLDRIVNAQRHAVGPR